MLVRELKLESGHDIEDYIHQSNLIEGFDSVHADDLLMKAWKKLLKIDELSDKVICQAQYTIVHHQDELSHSERGHYRNYGVMVGGRIAPDNILVPALMHNWLLDVHTAPPEGHHIAFEHIHPFADGNGRTGRLLMWWMQAKRGDILTYISKKEVQAYYQWFQ